MPFTAGTPIRLPAVVASIAVAIANGLPAQAQAAGATQEGAYLVTRSQTVAPTPPGMVGHKTTDRETRIGNVLTTEGNQSVIMMTIGGFVKKCPTAEGVAAGNFEFTLSRDEVNTLRGETQRTHTSNSLIAELKGQVGNDASVEHVEMQGVFTRRRNGETFRTPIPPTRFKPGGLQGKPDMEAMTRVVKMTAEISSATAILMAEVAYMAAELEWRKPNQCVELSFDPPSGTHPLGPSKSAQVQVALRTKDDKTPVAEAPLKAEALQGAGSVAPRKGQTRAGAALPLTYTAPASVRAGNGFGIDALSRAGVAAAEWKSLASPDKHAGWSGQIQWTLNVKEKERHTAVQDSSGNLFVQVNFMFKDGVGRATSKAEVKHSSEDRGMVDRGGGRFGDNVTYPKRASLDIEGSLGGGSPATVNVEFNAARGEYSIEPAWTPTVGTKRHVSCEAANCTTKDLYFSTNPGRRAEMWGKTGDPNHLQGEKTERLDDGRNIWTVTWNLSRSN